MFSAILFGTPILIGALDGTLAKKCSVKGAAHDPAAGLSIEGEISPVMSQRPRALRVVARPIKGFLITRAP